MRSFGPNRCPMVETLVAWPLTNTTQSSTPWSGGQRPFELAVDGALAGDQPARRCRGAVAVDGRLGRRIDVGMTGEAQVVVAREIREGFPADHRGRAGEAVVHAKKGIADAELLRPLVQDAQLLIIRMQIEAAPAIGNRVRARSSRGARLPAPAPARRVRVRLLRIRRCNASWISRSLSGAVRPCSALRGPLTSVAPR